MKSTHFTPIQPGSRTDAWLSRHFDSAQFSYQEIFGMFGPLLIDQFFIYVSDWNADNLNDQFFQPGIRVSSQSGQSPDLHDYRTFECSRFGRHSGCRTI